MHRRNICRDRRREPAKAEFLLEWKTKEPEPLSIKGGAACVKAENQRIGVKLPTETRAEGYIVEYLSISTVQKYGFIAF